MAKDDSSNVTANLAAAMSKRPHRLFESGTGNKSQSNSNVLSVRREARQIKSAPMTYKGR